MGKGLLLPVALFLALQYNGTSQTPYDSSFYIKNNEQVKVLDDFEDPATFNNWNGTLLLLDEFPAHGKSSLKLAQPQENPYG